MVGYLSHDPRSHACNGKLPEDLTYRISHAVSGMFDSNRLLVVDPFYDFLPSVLQRVPPQLTLPLDGEKDNAGGCADKRPED
jgi:hypothetical protein